MATIANTSDSAALNAALDQEFVKNFQGDATRLMEILGIFGLITSQIDTAPKREERGANVPMALLAALLRFLAFEE